MDDDDYIGGGSEVSVNGGDGESAVNTIVVGRGPVCGKKARCGCAMASGVGWGVCPWPLDRRVKWWYDGTFSLKVSGWYNTVHSMANLGFTIYPPLVFLANWTPTLPVKVHLVCS